MKQKDIPSPNPGSLGLWWVTLGKLPGLFFSLELVLIVAMFDYLTGYEIRLSVLYMLPIALATWTGGLWSGMFASGVAVICWLISFHSMNIYSKEIYLYWEGMVMIATFIVFVLLLTRLRDALVRADERFLRVLEGLHAGIYVVDETHDKVLYANQRLAHLIGVSPFSLQAKDFENRFNVMGTPTRPLASSTASHFISEEVRDELNGRWYVIQSGQIPWQNNQIVKLKALVDISEQKEAQILKQQHQEILNHTARLTALTEIASNLAHEINQPLMAIASYTDACLQLLNQSDYDKKAIANAIEKSHAQAVRAGHIINRTRDFIQRRNPTPTYNSINEAIHEAVQFVELELQDAFLTVDLQLANEIPPLFFDRILITQVIINLLHNATDAVAKINPSQRRIMIKTLVENDDGRALISVKDFGTGISETTANMLYTPFFTTKKDGLGLGLCICRSVIEAHAGRLWHESNPEGGTIFYFTLPSSAQE